MKVNFFYSDTKFKDEDKDFVKKFVSLLQEKFPLKTDVSIKFIGNRTGKMSTGSRTDKSVLKILSKNRLIRDIMRTLAHEWVHEYQRKVQKREQGPDIGGKNEDEANAFAGRIVKMFEKKYPKFEKKMYESKLLKSKIDLLTEQIVLVEKKSIESNLISEMKKIGIEKLPYSYSSLKKFIDSKTMDVHYNKHYKGYVDKLNKALLSKKGDMELEEIIKSISKFDNRVRNNAGGAFNHALFWKMLSPKKQIPKGEIYTQIKKDFGNIKKMKDEFNQAAKDRFGSGWTWLYIDKTGTLKIMSLPNQDNPLMNVVKKGGFPILGLDLWEHAYYLKYQNKRDEYISNFWNVVNWEFVNDLYLTKRKIDKKKIIKESDTIESELIKYKYNNIGFFKKMRTEKYYFNNIIPVEDDVQNSKKILLQGHEGDFLFDIQDVKFANNTASVKKETMDNNYPNFVKSKMGEGLTTAGITPVNIKKALQKTYPNNWVSDDITFTPGLRGVYTIGDQINDPNEDWSVMNFFDTKEEVKTMIYDKFKQDTNAGVDTTDIINWMSNLFKTDDEFTNKLVNRQWKSIKNGYDLEKKTFEEFIQKFDGKNIVTYPYGSKMDRWFGVDVTIDGINYQIKPLNGYKKDKDRNVYVVFTYNMKDYKLKKKIDKIAFVNKKEILIFDNKNYNLLGTTTLVFSEEPTFLNR